MTHHTSIHCLLVSACLSICLFATGCKEHYSDGERVGTITKFSKAGVIWDSWDGLLNITQTGMNSSGSPFAFSLDNDRDDQEHLVRILQECQVKGYKVKLKYHQVWGLKNVFSNRGESDYFIDDLEIIDRDFANPLKNSRPAESSTLFMSSSTKPSYRNTFAETRNDPFFHPHPHTIHHLPNPILS